jgi:hypothetical protein
MNMAEFLHNFWWLIFPIFGMYMAIQGSGSRERSTRDVITLIKSYTDQGKEPPPELLQSISKSLEAGVDDAGDGKNGAAWTFVIFAALGAGFFMGWWLNQTEDFAWAFLSVAVAMCVLAAGSLIILIFGRK